MTSLGCHAFGTRAGIRTTHRHRRRSRARWLAVPVLPPPGPSAPPGPGPPRRHAAGRRLLGSATFLLGSGRSDASGEASSGAPRPPSTVRVTPTPTPTPSLSPSPSPTSTKIDVPSTGTGTFVAAHATGAKVGHGARPLRYAVEVETGIDISPPERRTRSPTSLPRPEAGPATTPTRFSW
ncbi:hypothetical protein ACFQ51_38085 [Streptomyces kaempferi]